MSATIRRSSSLVLALVVGLLMVFAVTAAPKASATETLQQRAVYVASLQKGKPYQYGAAGPNAFDCSGLTKYVYGRLGKSLVHNAYSQYTHTLHLTHAQMRPGDLVFMNMSGGGTGGIDHVGIYAGGGYWWVARHSGTTITKQYIWTSHYWVGRVR